MQPAPLDLDILAGPILRRCDPSVVTIWLATEHDAALFGEVFDTKPVRKGGNRGGVALEVDYRALLGNSLGPRGHQRWRLAEHLFVHLILISPFERGGFPTGRIVAYDIRGADVETGEVYWTLRQLAESTRLTTAELELPSLVLQPRGSPLHAMYGSCRKFHGNGEDALAAGARHLFEVAASPVDRPTALFLIGDQIYADDVPDAIVPGIHRLSRRLTGGVDEELPAFDFGAGLPSSPKDFPATGQRMKPLQGVGFTSDYAGNHLMRFSEFAAAYLLAFDPSHWVGLLSGSDTMELRLYERDVPAVRRLLANVPTYMIFDDHEITDDWNRTPDWRKGVDGGEGGVGGGNTTLRRVVANGLAAYWAFQGLGNDPAAMAALGTPISSHLFATGSGMTDPTMMADAYERALLRFGNPGPGWSFTAPTDPTTLLVDCRTRRGARARPELGRKRSIGALVDDSVWPDLHALVRQSAPSPRHLIIVIGTPMYNLVMMEAGQEILADIGLGVGAGDGSDRWDEETWASWEVNQRELLEFCLDVGSRSVTLLSGDVHYSTSAQALVLRGRTETVRVRQFTSSSLKNAPGGYELLTLHLLQSQSLGTFTRRHGQSASGGNRITEQIRFESFFARAICISETNIGILVHRGDVVVNELLVPIGGTASGQDRHAGTKYRKELHTTW